MFCFYFSSLLLNVAVLVGFSALLVRSFHMVGTLYTATSLITHWKKKKHQQQQNIISKYRCNAVAENMARAMSHQQQEFIISVYINRTKISIEHTEMFFLQLRRCSAWVTFLVLLAFLQLVSLIWLFIQFLYRSIFK